MPELNQELQNAAEAHKVSVDELLFFEENHAEVLSRYRELCSEYNQTLTKLKAEAARVGSAQSMDLSAYTPKLRTRVINTTAYNPELLPADILLVPGVVKAVNTTKVGDLIRAGRLSADVALGASTTKTRVRVLTDQKTITTVWGTSVDGETVEEDADE
jgi:hypothetical protein